MEGVEDIPGVVLDESIPWGQWETYPEFLDFLARQHKDVLETIRDSRLFDDSTQETVSGAYDEFLDQFETSDGESIKPGTEPKAEPVTDEELEQEQIVKQKRS